MAAITTAPPRETRATPLDSAAPPPGPSPEPPAIPAPAQSLLRRVVDRVKSFFRSLFG